MSEYNTLHRFYYILIQSKIRKERSDFAAQQTMGIICRGEQCSPVVLTTLYRKISKCRERRPRQPAQRATQLVLSLIYVDVPCGKCCAVWCFKECAKHCVDNANEIVNETSIIGTSHFCLQKLRCSPTWVVKTSTICEQRKWDCQQKRATQGRPYKLYNPS